MAWCLGVGSCPGTIPLSQSLQERMPDGTCEGIDRRRQTPSGNVAPEVSHGTVGPRSCCAGCVLCRYYFSPFFAVRGRGGREWRLQAAVDDSAMCMWDTDCWPCSRENGRQESVLRVKRSWWRSALDGRSFGTPTKGIFYNDERCAAKAIFLQLHGYNLL